MFVCFFVCLTHGADVDHEVLAVAADGRHDAPEEYHLSGQRRDVARLSTAAIHSFINLVMKDTFCFKNKILAIEQRLQQLLLLLLRST